MEKDKSPINHQGGGGLASSSSSTSRYSLFPPGAAVADTSEPETRGMSSSSSKPNDANRSFSHDISGMPDLPPKNFGGHRRAHSEILSLPDDLNFDSDLGIVGCGADGPSFSDETDEDLFSMYLDMEKFNTATSSSSFAQQLQLPGSSTSSQAETFGVGGERPRYRHQHSQSMDGSTSIKPELLMSGSDGGNSLVDTKKAISAAKLADLALVDPKRAKRIWANRQSAARSKERKMRYISELERKVQTLQTEATTLSAQLTMLQRDTNGLTAENNELKLRLSTMEQQVHLQDALNDALRDEVQRLKMMTGAVGGPMMNFGSNYGAGQQFYPNNHAMHTLLAAHQFQQLQIQSQQQPQLQQQQSQQLQQQQQQQFQQQQTGDLKLKGSASSSSLRDMSDSNPRSD